MTDSDTLYFYPRKAMFAVFTMMFVVLTVLFTLFVVVTVYMGDYGISVVIGLLALLFALMTIIGIKNVLSSKPYLIFKDDVLIINAQYKHLCMAIEWKDIEGYDVRIANMNRVIELILHDEWKYLRRMSSIPRWLSQSNSLMNFRAFSITWRQLKHEDREWVIRELDNRALTQNEDDEVVYIFDDDTDEVHLQREEDLEQGRVRQQIDADHRNRQARSQIDRTYFVKAYGISFLITAVIFALSFVGDGFNPTFLILTFIMYPMAKLPWDDLIGFKFRHKIDQDESPTNVFLYRAVLFVHFILYVFSIVLGPIGILYSLIKFKFYKGDKRESATGETNEYDEVITENDGPFKEPLEEAEPLQVPFAIRFAVFIVHVIVIFGLAHLFMALGMDDWFILAAIIVYCLTFSIYTALYPGQRGYFLSLLAFLWRIVICFVIDLTLIIWTMTGEHNALVGGFVLFTSLFLIPSYLFYKFGNAYLRRLF